MGPKETFKAQRLGNICKIYYRYELKTEHSGKNDSLTKQLKKRRELRCQLAWGSATTMNLLWIYYQEVGKILE